MKTVKEWLETLPEPYRTQALENAIKSKLDDSSPDFGSAVIMGFIWEKSPQGWDYWNKIFIRASNEEFRKPTHNLYGWIPVSERLPEESDADENGMCWLLINKKKQHFRIGKLLGRKNTM